MKRMRVIRIRQPDDWHFHPRQGELMAAVLPWTARSFARGLAMGNTVPPIAGANDVVRWRSEMSAISPGFEPLIAIKLLQQLT